MDSSLRERKGFHSGELQVILQYKELFVLLISKYEVCMCCLYRTFMFVSPKIYNDREFAEKVCSQIFNELTIQEIENQCMKELVDKYVKGMKNRQSKFCWLCSGLLQMPYLQQLAQTVVRKIKDEYFGHKNKYKLNIRIHTIINIKYQIFSNFLVHDLINLTSKQKAIQVHRRIIEPLFERNSLEIKAVLKWVLSNTLNQFPTQIFTLNSTINEDEETVIVNLEVQHDSQQLSSLASGLLGPYLHLSAVKSKANKHKKVKIDLEAEEYHVTWTSSLVSKITNLQLKQWMEMAQNNPTFLMKMMKTQSVSQKQIRNNLTLLSKNIYLCGKYVKFSRYLSQTPWLVGGKKLAESSLQEEIQSKIYRHFYPQEVPENSIEIKFHAGGREDIDVRMLKGGRPFVIEFVNPRFNLKDIDLNSLVEAVGEHSIKEQDNERFKVKLLEKIINSGNDVAQVDKLEKTTANYISHELKAAEGQKIKHYICFIKSEQPLSSKDKQQLQKHQNLQLVQKTPIRVLHRRTLMYRNKTIHKMLFHQMTKFGAVLEIWASAGTYIKEFVHGDLNRTQPNVGSLLQKSVDILQLDVGSLKEGQWEEGAYEEMKMGLFPWEQK